MSGPQRPVSAADFIPDPGRLYLCPYCNKGARLRDEGVVIDSFKNPCHEPCLLALGVPLGAPSIIGANLDSSRACADCGHPHRLHGPGSRCGATVDLRPLGVGGDTLTPCRCRGFREVTS